MKVKSIPSRWLSEEGRRFDCGPYMSGAREAKDVLARLAMRKDRLQEVTKGGMAGIVNAGRIKRLWVDDPAYGVPFLSSSDILQADLSSLPLISKRVVAENPQLLLEPGWTLITRSGTIGRMVYTRPDMGGMACSEHVMRVLPDAEHIPSGYLYAYLSSKFGVPLVVSGTYGSIIQSIEPHHIANLPVPRLDEALEQRVHALVEEAARLRTAAAQLFVQAEEQLYARLKMQAMKEDKEFPRPLYSIVSSNLIQARSDAFYFSTPNAYSRKGFDLAEGEQIELGDVADVFIPGIFKRLYADHPDYGYAYITGADVFQLAPTSDRILMAKVAHENRLLLQSGMILVHEAGQLGGLIGRSVFVGSYLEGFACTNNMVRVTPMQDAGYVFALLASGHGVRLLARESAGSSIPHMDVTRIKRLRLPWTNATTREFISTLTTRARDYRDDACERENEARQLVEQAIEEAA